MLQNVHAIVLAETPERTKRLSDHLSSIGISWTPFEGVRAIDWGLTTLFKKNPINLRSGDTISQKYVGMHLSHYFLWRRFNDSTEPVMTILEDDAAFNTDWSIEYKTAMDSVPDDWQILLLGSGNTSDKQKTQISGNVWNVDQPQCTHAYMVKRNALPVLLLTQKLVWAEIDVSLIYRSYPHLKVYTVLPRIAYQHGQEYIIP